MPGFWKRSIILGALVGSSLIPWLTATVVAGDDGGDAPNRKAILTSSLNLSWNWAGYVVASSFTQPKVGSVSRVAGEWTVPAVACGRTDTAASIWVGIDGYANGTVEQVGTRQSCRSGQPVYSAFYEMYPNPLTPVTLAVKPGDVVQGEVRYDDAQGTFVLAVTDATSGQSVSTVQAGSASRASAGWVVETPSNSSGSLLSLAYLGSVKFRNASVTVNGATGAIADSRWHAQSVTMVGSLLVTLAQPGLLSGTGDGFTVSWAKLL